MTTQSKTKLRKMTNRMTLSTTTLSLMPHTRITFGTMIIINKDTQDNATEHNTKQNDTQQRDKQQNDTMHSDNQQKGRTRHNDTQHYDTWH
jgi:hypothetical protein